jgi:putative restriction endonuclease
MKKGETLWTEEQLMLAINLYSKIPFGRMDHRNKDVRELALLIGRTPDAVSRMLGNFASLDPVQQARGIRGLPNAGTLAKKIYKEFYENWDKWFEESEQLLAKYKSVNVSDMYPIEYLQSEIGMTKERLVNTRLNQYRFRQLVLSNFNCTCCITGINQSELLIASHITPWSAYGENRLNPANGLCLNALHDKAFDKGLSTTNQEIGKHFLALEGRAIILPKKFMIDPEFLKIHNGFFYEISDSEA